MLQTFFPFPSQLGAFAITQNMVTVTSTSATAATTNAVKWIVYY